MKTRSLHIILLCLLLPVLAYGQQFNLFEQSVTINGQPRKLVGKVRAKGQVNYRNNSIIVAEHEFKQYIDLTVGFESGEDLGAAGMVKVTLSTSSPFLEMPTTIQGTQTISPASKSTFKISAAPVIGTEKGTINFRLDLPDGSSTNRSVNVILKPVASKADGSSCDADLPGGDRLKCLRALQSENPKVLAAIQQLEQERNIAEQALKKWTLESNGKNVYTITCSACRLDDFTLKGSSVTPEALSNGWRIAVKEDTEFVLSSKGWPELEKVFFLEFQEVPTSNQDNGYQSSNESEKPGTVTDNTYEAKAEPPPVANNTEEVDDGLEATQGSLSVPMASNDRFWEDSIAGSLSLNNFLGLDERTRAHLSEYFEDHEGSGIRKLIAWSYLNPYLTLLSVIAIVTALYFIIIGKRPPRAQKLQERKTKPQQPAIEPDPQPKDAEPVKPNKPVEDEIMIEEVVHEVVASNRLSLSEVTKNPDYTAIDLAAAWQDTQLNKIHFKASSILAIGEMLAVENAYNPELDNVEELAEIGGFLLGHVFPTDESFEIAISTFIPITPEQNDRYTVKFGDEAWVELDDAMKKHPEQRLVGWFHTHPGHGLFLSNADIKVHSNTFLKPYQFAMEIDPVTPDCDIAFFTWKKDGTLNNVQDRRLSQWWSFRNLLNRAKKVKR